MIFGVDLSTYSYDPGYVTDLKSIAQAIMDDHDATFGPTSSTTTSTTLSTSTTTTLAPAPGCAAVSLSGCRIAEKSTLQYRDNVDDDRDRLTYKWNKGEATSQAEFGDPENSTQFDLCLYRGGSEVLVVDEAAI
jgi:hypothetical protein